MTIENCDFYSYRSLENIFVGSADREITYAPDLIEKSKALRKFASKPTPRRFLPNDIEDILVAGLRNRGIKPTRIWLMPFYMGYREYEALATNVVISLSKENFNHETERCSIVHYAVRDVLEDVRCGHPVTCVTWNEVIDTCVPNPVVPEYLPSWKE